MNYNYWRTNQYPPENPGWGGTQLILGIVFYMAVTYLFPLTNQFGSNLLKFIPDVETQKIVYYLISQLGITLLSILFVFILSKRSSGAISNLGFTSENFFISLILGILSGLVITMLVIGSGVLLGNFIGLESPLPIFVKNFVSASKYNLEYYFYVISFILIPVSLVVLFQGLVYPVLRSFNVGVGIFITAVLFAASFLSLVKAIPLFLAGVVLTYIYERSGNILAPIFACSIWQGLILWLIFFASGK